MIPLPRHSTEPGRYTLGLIKPDGYKQGLLGPILTMAAACDAQLHPELIFEAHLTVDDVRFLYGHIEAKLPEVWPGLLSFSLSGPVYVMILRGNGCTGPVAAWRTLMGATRSVDALPHTIRGRWGSKTTTHINVVHGSDTEARALEEMHYFTSLRVR